MWSLGEAVPGSRKPFSEVRHIPKKIFVGNLHPETSGRELEELFSEVGDITEVRILRHPETRMPKGCAFVTFDSDQNAALALDVFGGRRLRGNPLRVDFAHERARPVAGDEGDESAPRHRAEAPSGSYFDSADDYRGGKRRRRGGDDWRRLRGTKRVL